ncbi:hypothetical protein F991_00180 [Acinetobacter sp. CIP-A165]|nr:hypothetical protein F991_00180 [Acinetobacter sp. CIP-A165]
MVFAYVSKYYAIYSTSFTNLLAELQSFLILPVKKYKEGMNNDESSLLHRQDF